MNLLTWLIVGLCAGVLAALVIGGYGMIADIVVGMLGALIGGWLFAHFGWHSPIAGIGGAIFTAFVGSLILLAILHLFHSLRYRGRGSW